MALNVLRALLSAGKPLSPADVTRHFDGAERGRVSEILEMFSELGQARQLGGAEPFYAA